MGITTLSTLLHFASDEKHADKHILGMHQELADALPDGVVPIAIDPCTPFPLCILGPDECLCFAWSGAEWDGDL